MPSYYLKVKYTYPDGRTGELMGTQTIATIDGRLGHYKASRALIDNSRFIAGWDRIPDDDVSFVLEGVTPTSLWTSNRVYPLPDGRRSVPIIPMTLDERREYLANGGKVHP